MARIKKYPFNSEQISNLNQDIIDALQDDLVTSTTEALPSQFKPEPEVLEEEQDVTGERPFRRFRLRRPPNSRNNFRFVIILFLKSMKFST